MDYRAKLYNRWWILCTIMINFNKGLTTLNNNFIYELNHFNQSIE